MSLAPSVPSTLDDDAHTPVGPVAPVGAVAPVSAVAPIRLPRTPRTRARTRAVVWLMVTAVVAGLTAVAVDRPGPWAVAAVIVVSAVVLGIVRRGFRRVVVSSLSLGAVVACVDYVSWRFDVTNWLSWFVAAPLLAAELFGAAHSLGIFYTVWPARDRPYDVTRNATTQKVFVMIPTVDEGVEIVGATVRAAMATRLEFLRAHPHGDVTVVVCNDGRVAGYPGWRDIDELVESLGAVAVTRTTPGGAKAGNIEHARDLLDIHGDALMVVFDADQIAEPEFLTETIPLLGDQTVAWVQTGQYYSNVENPVTRWAEDQQAIFYRILCPGKSASNSAFICGTNVAIRASALDEIGGFPQDSVTEDFAASLKLHARWRSVFVPGVLARGLGPMDLPSYFTQQNRWAIGTLGVLRQSFWSLVSRRSGLTAGQSVQYMLACTHYLSGVKDFVFLVSPIVYLFFGFAAVQGATLDEFLLHFVPFFVVSQTAFWIVAGRHTSLRGIFIGFASSPTLFGSLFTVVTGRKVRFAVTAKSRSGRPGVRHLLPIALGIAAGVAAVAYAASRTLGPADLVSIVWVGYSLVMLTSVFALGIRDIRGRSIGPATAEQGDSASPERGEIPENVHSSHVLT